MSELIFPVKKTEAQWGEVTNQQHSGELAESRSSFPISPSSSQSPQLDATSVCLAHAERSCAEGERDLWSSLTRSWVSSFLLSYLTPLLSSHILDALWLDNYCVFANCSDLLSEESPVRDSFIIQEATKIIVIIHRKKEWFTAEPLSHREQSKVSGRQSAKISHNDVTAEYTNTSVRWAKRTSQRNQLTAVSSSLHLWRAALHSDSHTYGKAIKGDGGRWQSIQHIPWRKKWFQIATV